MNSPCILSIDQGTTNTKAVLVDPGGAVLAKASRPLTSHYPRPGWAEQSAEGIWASVIAVIADVLGQADDKFPVGLAISNQRETLVVWDADTGESIAPAILWQCRRTAAASQKLVERGADPAVVEATGLSINPLFPAGKLAWVMENVPRAADLAARGKLRAGTVDAFLLFRLTGGRTFATDHSNASRTQLFNTRALAWDQNLGTLFGVPLSVLPEPRPSDSLFGETAAGTTALGAGVPILAMMGDSHAALYGHGISKPGLVKATYGTGSSLMTLTDQRVLSRHGLSGTIAWTDKRGTAYALEGNITVSAQALAYVATMLGLDGVASLSSLAQTVPHSDGVTFVPALAGLGAPHWNDNATGTIGGLTLASQPAHVAHAAFDAVAMQICDVFNAMEKDSGIPLKGLKADGGATVNDFLMQLQANLLGRTVSVGDVAEVGAIGVAAMGLRAAGYEIASSATEPRRFDPMADAQKDAEATIAAWKRAIARVLADV